MPFPMIGRHLLGALALLMGATLQVQGAPVTYQVSINTPTLNGNVGSLEFQFNGTVPGSLPATATISNVTGGTFVGGTASPIGDVIPGTGFGTSVVLGNSTVLNDLLQDFNFGTNLQFDVTFAGTALDFPDPMTPATAFSLTIWSLPAAGGTQVDPLDASGAALIIDGIGQNAFSVTQPINGSATLVTVPGVAAIPEPATMVLLGMGLVGGSVLGAVRRGRRTGPVTQRS